MDYDDAKKLNPKPTEICTFKTVAVAGLLTRKQLRRDLEDYCRRTGLVLTIMEDRGWLESVMSITVRGAWSDISELVETMKRVF